MDLPPSPRGVVVMSVPSRVPSNGASSQVFSERQADPPRKSKPRPLPGSTLSPAWRLYEAVAGLSVLSSMRQKSKLSLVATPQDMALLNSEWVNFTRRGGRFGPMARVEAAASGGPLTLVDNCGCELCPCKGWPSAPACGGFGLDKSIARSIVAHHSVNEQGRANFEGHPLVFQKRPRYRLSSSRIGRMSPILSCRCRRRRRRSARPRSAAAYRTKQGSLAVSA
jgi:hypothetical protein